MALTSSGAPKPVVTTPTVPTPTVPTPATPTPVPEYTAPVPTTQQTPPTTPVQTDATIPQAPAATTSPQPAGAPVAPVAPIPEYQAPVAPVTPQQQAIPEQSAGRSILDQWRAEQEAQLAALEAARAAQEQPTIPIYQPVTGLESVLPPSQPEAPPNLLEDFSNYSIIPSEVPATDQQQTTASGDQNQFYTSQQEMTSVPSPGFPAPGDSNSNLNALLTAIYGPNGMRIPGASDIQKGNFVGVNGNDMLNAIMQEYQSAYVQGVLTNQARYADIMAGYGREGADLFGTGGMYDAMQTNAAAAEGQYATGMETALGNLNNAAALYGHDYGADWDARTNAIMSQYDGLGQQQRTDMINRYTADQAAAGQKLQSRGLGNTTVASSVDRGIGAERESDMRRLNEQLTASRIAAQTGLTGDAITARERQRRELADTYRQAVASQSDYYGSLHGIQEKNIDRQAEIADAYAQLSQRMLQSMEGRTDEYPTLSELANLFLQSESTNPQIIPAGRGYGGSSTNVTQV